MYQFEYHRPKTIDEAVRLLADNEEGKVLAGGMTLLPTMKQRLASPSDLVDLGALDELRGIQRQGDKLVIGAMTTHAEVAASADVADAIPALAYLAGHIGDAQVRNRGTLGGSIANNDPAADYPAALMALGATVHTNRREMVADDFFTGMFETALEETELVTKVTFPTPERAAYQKFAHPASRYALVGVFVAKHADGVRVAVTGAGPGVFRVPEMESRLSTNFSPDAIEGVTVDADELNSDIHASNEYRAHLVGVLAKRAVAEAAKG